MRIYKIAQSDESRKKLDILNQILMTMDIPSARKTDPRWLMRNLAVRNSDNPNFKEAISLIKELGSELANPLMQEQVDALHKVWNKQ